MGSPGWFSCVFVSVSAAQGLGTQVPDSRLSILGSPSQLVPGRLVTLAWGVCRRCRCSKRSHTQG